MGSYGEAQIPMHIPVLRRTWEASWKAGEEPTYKELHEKTVCLKLTPEITTWTEQRPEPCVQWPGDLFDDEEIELHQAVRNMEKDHSSCAKLEPGLRSLVQDESDDDDEAEDVEVLRPPRTQQPDLITLDELRK